ncbi:hypothetical protein QAD02_013170 [Eretmocerus hayati]|uniref:Uncharacterized protein n=1 Tax=Eretmocerus hayati TaxID=131215 RepID=A0ACC2P2P3_9HYME|nr:hypothetical protein QAD02_013170 [Eretmocerus hayati]
MESQKLKAQSNQQSSDHVAHCDQEFGSSWAKRCHDCPEKLLCLYCGESMESALKKKQHQQDYCKNRQGHFCDICKKVVAHQTTLTQHQKLKHSSFVEEFKCPKCPRKFKFQTKLKFHLKSAHVLVNAHVCRDCKIQFKTQVSLKKHRIQKHDTIASKKIRPVCQELVPIYGEKKHMAIHNCNIATEKFICKKCKKCFSTKENLSFHFEKSHPKKKCIICEEEFASDYLFKKHSMNDHENIHRVLTCSQCSKTFISQSEYKSHMLHHSEKRSFKCEICGLKRKTQYNLMQHMENKHSIQRTFKCDSCNWTFKRRSDLTRHQLTHSSLKPYSCEVCHMKFKYLNNKNRHQKNNMCIDVSENEVTLEENESDQ